MLQIECVTGITQWDHRPQNMLPKSESGPGGSTALTFLGSRLTMVDMETICTHHLLQTANKNTRLRIALVQIEGANILATWRTPRNKNM